jgi:adenylate cyclase
MMGGLHWLLNKITDLPDIRKKPPGLIFVLRFAGFIVILSMYDIFDIMAIYDEQFSLLPKKFTSQYIISSHSMGSVLYLLFIDSLYAWLYQIRTIFGKKIFRNLLQGKYRTPKIEKRLFMFFDMKDSTTHEEQLGHVRFTGLIQECFRDFALIALRRDVNIYQYIGDEVIVSWYIKSGIKDQNCLRLFFDFQDKLERKRHDYEQKYKMKPDFKAGIHSGSVTVAEIGLFKKGIEYLGDVLNTASRLQGLCNKYQTDLLISKEVFDLLDESDDFKMEIIQNIRLKGKGKRVDIFSVKEKTRESNQIK